MYRSYAIIIITFILLLTTAPAQAQTGTWTTPNGATASDSLGGSYGPGEARDNDLTYSYWTTFSTYEWIRFDMGTGMQIAGCRIYWEPRYANKRAERIEISSDGFNWTLQYQNTSSWEASGEWHEYSWTAVNARYVRVYVRASSGSYAYMTEFDADVVVPTPTSTATATPTSTPTTTPTPTPTSTPTPTPTNTAPPPDQSCATIVVTLETIAAQQTPLSTYTPAPTTTPTETPDCADYSASIDNVLTSGDVGGTITNTTTAPVIAESIRYTWSYPEAVSAVEDFALGADCLLLAGHGTIWGSCDGVSEDDYSWTAATGVYTISAMTAHQFVAGMSFDIAGSEFVSKFLPTDFGLDVWLDNGCFVEAAPAPRPVPTCLPGGCGTNNLCCMHARDAAFLAACIQTFEEGKCVELMQRLGPPNW